MGSRARSVQSRLNFERPRKDIPINHRVQRRGMSREYFPDFIRLKLDVPRNLFLQLKSAKMKLQLIATLLAAAALVHVARAHMSITFPPARFPNYDFLDNVRTGGPCGVPGEKGCRGSMVPWGTPLIFKYYSACCR